jgi:hypothetical protein
MRNSLPEKSTEPTFKLLDDIKGWEEFQLAKRSNSFVRGAIQNLQAAQPPIVNLLSVTIKGTSSPEYLEYLAWQERISIAEECIKTVMQQGGWRPKNASVATKDDLLALKISQFEGFIDVLESIVELQPQTAAPPVVQETKKDTTPITPAYQPKQDIINHIDNNKGSFRGWLAVAHLEIDGIVSPKGKCQIDRVNLNYSSKQ